VTAAPGADRLGPPAGPDDQPIPEPAVSGRNAVAGRTVTSKVLAILGTFAPGGSRLTLTEMSRRADLPIGTVHRLARELVAWGDGIVPTAPSGHDQGSLRSH